MIEIPFTKLHGASNDFLLTWSADVPPSCDLPDVARRICARHTGIGADGWMLVDREPGGLHTRLFNSDGSEPEISGNGTRCAAAFALLHDESGATEFAITTKAGLKHLRLLDRCGKRFMFEMDMGAPQVEELYARLELAGETFDATVVNVGNPQCAIFVEQLPENWLSAAREAERHPRFPYHSNVSFVEVIDRHTVSAVFFERGAGVTRSSGTGSMGAAVAAILRGASESPVEVKTPAGSLYARWDGSVHLTGPAAMIGEGRFLVEY